MSWTDGTTRNITLKWSLDSSLAQQEWKLWLMKCDLLWCKSMPAVARDAQGSCSHIGVEVLRKSCKYLIITNLLTHQDKALISNIKSWGDFRNLINSPYEWSIQVWAHSFIMLQLDALRKIDQKQFWRRHRGCTGCVDLLSETEPNIKQI